MPTAEYRIWLKQIGDRSYELTVCHGIRAVSKESIEGSREDALRVAEDSRARWKATEVRWESP